MQRWEWIDVWVPLATKTRQTGKRNWDSRETWAEHDLESEQARTEAKKLAKEGWELVAILPRFRAWGTLDLSGQGGPGAGYSYERGYNMFFKRPIESSQIAERGEMNLMEIGVLLVEYSVLEKGQKKAFVREHPELKDRGVVRWALAAAQMRGRTGDIQAASRYASAAYDLATELSDYQLATEASDLLAEMR